MLVAAGGGCCRSCGRAGPWSHLNSSRNAAATSDRHPGRGDGRGALLTIAASESERPLSAASAVPPPYGRLRRDGRSGQEVVDQEAAVAQGGLQRFPRATATSLKLTFPPASSWPMPDADLVEAIGAILASPFHGEGHRKLWARRCLAGVRTSKRRVLRRMGAHDLLARLGAVRRRTHTPRRHHHRAPIAYLRWDSIPDTVDTMWGADPTTPWPRVTVPGWYGEGERVVAIHAATVVGRRSGMAVVPIRWAATAKPSQAARSLGPLRPAGPARHRSHPRSTPDRSLVRPALATRSHLPQRTRSPRR
jgi:hypothetical protein